MRAYAGVRDPQFAVSTPAAEVAASEGDVLSIAWNHSVADVKQSLIFARAIDKK